MNSFLDKLFRWLRFHKIIKYIPKNSIVCDIGCGFNGYFLKSISDFIKQGVGLDKDVDKFKDSNLEFKKIKVFKNTFLNQEKFDIITIIAVLEHLDCPQEVLDESFRILKKGGKLIITTPTPLAKPILEFLAFKLKLIDQNEIKDHKNYFWPQKIKQMLLNSGFKKENVKTRFFELYLNNLIVVQK